MLDLKTGIWKARDGREIPVRDMTDSHLLNTIKFVGRKRFEFLSDSLSVMCKLQGEQALLAAESEAEKADQVYEDWLSFLMAESKRRGLKK